MPNPYFQFKQFTIHQDACTMKVCTDSCLFGAWAANWLIKNKKDIENILDIGAGTGLLTLLLAQKLDDANFDSIEIESLSAQQAKENFRQSPWKEKLHVYQSSIQNFFPEKKYDFIISNPPFYQYDLQSENKAKNIAYHNAGLTLEELISALKRLITSTGNFAILQPYHRTSKFEKLSMEAGFFLIKKTKVRQTARHSYFRSMCIFSEENISYEEDEIVIKDEFDNYTSAFIFLLKDYYLYL